jgi:hypothetical protein
MKIDVDTNDFIDWDDLSTYLLLRSEGEKMMNSHEPKLYDSNVNVIHTDHKEMIIKVIFVQEFKRYITCCREGPFIPLK